MHFPQHAMMAKWIWGQWVVGSLIFLSGCGGAPNAGAFAPQQPGIRSADYVVPLRLSRAFFEGSVTENVSWTAASAPLSGPASWKDYPTTQPAPGPGAIADFRDHPGCISVSSDSTLETCFVISPDVSSVDLAPERVSLQGVSSWAQRNHPQGCGVRGEPVWVGASRTQTQVILQYSIPTFTGTSCNQPMDSQMTITLQKT